MMDLALGNVIKFRKLAHQMTKCQLFLDFWGVNFEDLWMRTFLEQKVASEGNILLLKWNLYIEHTQN